MENIIGVDFAVKCAWRNGDTAVAGLEKVRQIDFSPKMCKASPEDPKVSKSTKISEARGLRWSCLLTLVVVDVRVHASRAVPRAPVVRAEVHVAALLAEACSHRPPRCYKLCLGRVSGV